MKPPYQPISQDEAKLFRDRVYELEKENTQLREILRTWLEAYDDPYGNGDLKERFAIKSKDGG